MYIILWSGLVFGWEGEYWVGEYIIYWAERRWVFKGTLHYIMQNAKGDKPFILDVHVMRMIL